MKRRKRRGRTTFKEEEVAVFEALLGLQGLKEGHAQIGRNLLPIICINISHRLHLARGEEGLG